MIELSVQSSFSQPLTLALGYFDCVHRGHLELLRRTVRLAAENRSLPAVFTFRDMPGKGLPVVSYRDRLVLLERAGVKVVVCADFDEVFARQSAERFLRTLDDRFSVAGFVCGEDFRFGRDALGDAGRLARFARKRHKDCLFVPLLTDGAGEKISSRAVRSALAAGDCERAADLCGAPVCRSAKVIEGFHLGRTLGFATANLDFEAELCEIADGVYKTRTAAAGQNFASVTFVGTAATFDRQNKTVETHLIDADEQLYGQRVRVCFLKKLRDNRKFATKDDLIRQVRSDIEASR